MKLITALAISFTLLTGCKSKIAMDYNDLIVQKQKLLDQSMSETEPNLKNFFTSFEYDSIVAISTRMETKIDSIISEVTRKPAPNVKQGKNFKEAAVHYFEYMKSIYTAYKNYGTQTTPEGRMIAQLIIPKVTEQEAKAIADMQEAQRIFAKDNGFKIHAAK